MTENRRPANGQALRCMEIRGGSQAVEEAVSMPGLDKATVQKLADEAHAKVCPYSNATRGNVDVKVTVA